MHGNMRLLPFDFDDDGLPHTTAVSNCDPFMRPDYRSKKNTRPQGRVVHKRKPRRVRVVWESVV
jgi:hypothetical protein